VWPHGAAVLNENYFVIPLYLEIFHSVEDMKYTFPHPYRGRWESLTLTTCHPTVRDWSVDVAVASQLHYLPRSWELVDLFNDGDCSLFFSCSSQYLFECAIEAEISSRSLTTLPTIAEPQTFPQQRLPTDDFREGYGVARRPWQETVAQ